MNDRLDEYRRDQAGWAFLLGIVFVAVVSYALGFVTCVVL